MFKKLTRLAVLGLALLGVAQARELFVRPMTYWVIPTVDGYSNAIAGGFASGVYFGKADRHELSFETAYTNWSYSESYYNFYQSSRHHFTPMLLNYRVHMDGPISNTRLFIGPSLGLTYSRFTYAYGSSNWHYSDWEHDLTFTISGSCGVLVNLGRRLDLEFAYRYLHSEDPDYGSSIYTEDFGAHMLSVGLNVRF